MKKAISAAAWLRGAIRLLLAEARLASRRRHAVKELKRLSSRQLADIGIDRQQIREVVDRMLTTPSTAQARRTAAEVAAQLRDQAEPVKGWQKAA